MQSKANRSAKRDVIESGLIGLVGLTLLPIAWSAHAVWTLDQKTWVILAAIGLGYLAALTYLYMAARESGLLRIVQLVISVVAMLAPAMVLVMLWHQQYSRFALLTAVALAVGLVWLALADWRRPLLKRSIFISLAGLAVSVQLGLGAGVIAHRPAKAASVDSRINSALYELAVTSFQHFIPRPHTNQGGITKFGHGYMLVTGDGDLYLFSTANHAKRLQVRRLALRVPIDAAAFDAAIAGTAVDPTWFRVADVIAEPTAKGIRIFVSHHFWNTQKRCFVLRVSSVEGPEQAYTRDPVAMTWNTVFETTPCVPLANAQQPATFYGLEDGGRMAFADADHILLGVGDHGLNDWDSTILGAAPQDPDKSYGKIIELDLANSTNRIYSSGHRNPQGLTVSAAGTVWSTEHGPQGGDEFNLIREGHNYGWPLATYGVEYGTHAWPLSLKAGSHGGFERPYFAWIPSIGVSSLVEMTSAKFERWRGDLVIASLAGQALWRMRVRDDRVVLVEQINVGERIRDVIQGHEGELVLWTDSESLIFIQPAEEDLHSGQSMFAICAGCHVAGAAQATAIGPSLQGIVGRRVAAAPNFEYSPALQAFGGDWTAQRLDQFLANPQGTVPGTSMRFPGISDPAGRRSLIDYLTDPKSELNVPPPAREI